MSGNKCLRTFCFRGSFVKTELPDTFIWNFYSTDVPQNTKDIKKKSEMVFHKKLPFFLLKDKSK